MRTTSIATLLTSIFLLSGCVSPAQQAAAQEKQNRMYETIPVCNGEKDCSVKWDMAQLWVVRNASYKIQTSTSVLIETYSSSRSDNNDTMAVRVTKEPMGGGKYKILAEVTCLGIRWNCDAVNSTLDFNQKVGAAIP